MIVLYCIFYLQKTITNYDKKNISNHMIITLDLLGQQDKFHFFNLIITYVIVTLNFSLIIVTFVPLSLPLWAFERSRSGIHSLALII